MANPAYPPGAFFKENLRSQKLEKHQKDVVADVTLADAYRKVEAREGNRCQATGVELSPRTRDETRLREHHHLKGRNVKPEWVSDPVRIILCSKRVHDYLTAKTLLAIGTDARTVRFAWNEKQIHGKPPFRLKQAA